MSRLISADKLTVGYTAPLISDICFQVRAGEIMTLIGPNGSGKSTILKTLAGELKKLGGTVWLENMNTDDLSPKDKAKKLSVLLTERIRTQQMTCREVVETGRYPYTGYFGVLTKADREAVDRAIELVKIGDYADADFGAISDGQRQRVMLARAICQEPKILILDEPTSFLDIHHKITFLETLRQLTDEKGLAVVMSMHELDFAQKISDYSVCVKDGTIYRTGKPEEIFVARVIQGLFDIPKDVYEQYFSV